MNKKEVKCTVCQMVTSALDKNESGNGMGVLGEDWGYIKVDLQRLTKEVTFQQRPEVDEGEQRLHVCRERRLQVEGMASVNAQRQECAWRAPGTARR